MNDKIPDALHETTCGTCVYCQPGPRTKEDVLSRVCYRHPPTAIGVMTNQGIIVASVRPEIRPDTVACGEYDDGTLDDGAPTLAGLTS